MNYPNAHNCKVLVLGASMKDDRYSNRAVKLLRTFNFEVVALGNKAGKIEDVEIQQGLIHFENVHTVTLYLNSENQKPYYNYILSLKPERVIFNPGTENLEFEKLLRQNNISYEVACTLVLLNTGNFIA